MTKNWKMTYSPSYLAKIEQRAQDAAEDYRTGYKVRRWESPKMIALHGRDPWPAEVAAQEAYEDYLHIAKVNGECPTGIIYRHYARKLASHQR